MSRATAGAMAAAAGRLFEGQIKNLLEVSRRSGGPIAWWSENQPAYRPIGGGRFIPVAAGGADVTGVIRGGLALAIEIKSYDEERFYRSRLPAGQVEHLEAVASAGGLAVLVVQLRALQGSPAWAVPWRGAPWRALRSAPSLGPEEMAGHELRRPDLLAPFLRICTRCNRAKLVDGRGPCEWCP